MFTRADYMQNRCTHEEYYAQFVTPGIVAGVRRFLAISPAGEKRDPVKFVRAALAEDKHLNGIALRRWDALGVTIFGKGYQQAIFQSLEKDQWVGAWNDEGREYMRRLMLAGEELSASVIVCTLKQAAKMIAAE